MDEPMDVSHLRLRSRIRVACTPSEAYDLISDVGAMASWKSELVCARYDDGHGPSVVVDDRSIGQWTYRFQSDHDGTWIEEAWQVNNWIPILGRTPEELLQLRSHTADMMDDTLRALARHVGET